MLDSAEDVIVEVELLEGNLIAVSKSFGADSIRGAYKLGCRDFGENYAAEAVEKIEALEDLDIKWHFLGRVQSGAINKIVNIEKGIVDKCEDINSKSCYRIDEQLSHKYIKIFDQNKLKLGHYKNLSILLKISGIWSSNKTQQYGLTFRFFINY